MMMTRLFYMQNFEMFDIVSFVSAWEIPDAGVTPENKVSCENDRLKLNCGNSSMGLVIYSAQFGRTEPGHVICPYNGDKNDQNYNCGEKDVTEELKGMCAKKSKCKVRVKSVLFGDPCPYTAHPYLNLVYACGKCVWVESLYYDKCV